MKTILPASVLAFLLVISPSVCFALMTIEVVTPARAKELGIDIRAQAAGPDAVRIELEFATQGKLKSYHHVDLEMKDGGKLWVSTMLREGKSAPGRVVVAFAAGRADLDKITLRVVTSEPALGGAGYDLPMKELVDLAKVH